MQDLLRANGGDIRLALAAYNGGQGGADFLRDKAYWALDKPAPFIKGDAENNKKWVVQSAGYQKSIIEAAKRQKPMGNYGEVDINRERTPQSNVTVKVENATGGNATVQAQQAAGRG
jgi:hypothetical protein